MKCKQCDLNSDNHMELVATYDDPQPPGGGHVYAYNVFQCRYCGALCKQNVWHDAGETWITLDNFINGITLTS